MPNYLIVIVGPTAIGKTALSIEVASRYGTGIISADSRQFYRELNIGTAKPSAEELALVQHHFIDCRSITEDYSAGQFEVDAMAAIASVHKNKPVAVMVGGSGLYIDAVCSGMDDIPKTDFRIREELEQRLEKEGLVILQKELKKVDPEFYAKADIDNPRRVTRALEVSASSGSNYSSFLTSCSKERPFRIVKIGLKQDRETLYDRINERVDHMINSGLVEEAKSLYGNRHLNALQTVGYRECFDYMDGKHTLEEAIELIKQNTRRYAKRQLTWFSKDREINWYSYESRQSIVPLLGTKVPDSENKEQRTKSKE